MTFYLKIGTIILVLEKCSHQFRFIYAFYRIFSS